MVVRKSVLYFCGLVRPRLSVPTHLCIQSAELRERGKVAGNMAVFEVYVYCKR